MQKRRMPKAQQMMNKQKQVRVSYLFRKRKSIWRALYADANVAWELAYQISWDGMARRHKQKQ
jgi:hypothetical protein